VSRLQAWSAEVVGAGHGLQRAEYSDAVGDRAPGDVGVEGDRVELVRDPGVQVEFHGHPGAAQRDRVGEVLVAEDVDLTDLDVGRG
jgi:hypothetical protein